MTDSSIDWYEIKGRYMAGEKPRHLAQMYEIDPKQLSNIIVRQGWRKQREEIRLKVAEEFVDAQRELNTKAMQFVNLVLSSLINEDGTLNWEACKTIKSGVLRLCLQMAMPEKVKVREITHTFGEGPEPWRTYTEPPSAEDTSKVSKNEQKSEYQNNSPPEATSAKPIGTPDMMRQPDDVSKNEQKSAIQNNSSPTPTPPESAQPGPAQPSKLLMLAQLPQAWQDLLAKLAQDPCPPSTYFSPGGLYPSPLANNGPNSPQPQQPPLSESELKRIKTQAIQF